MIVVIKRGGLLLLAMIMIVAFLIFSLRKTVPAISINPNTIIVDAGHGEPDGGSVGKLGILEKDLNLDVAKKLSEKLTNSGYNVIMTRTDNNGLQKNLDASIREQKRTDLRERVKIINDSDAAMLVSIHMNFFTDAKYSGPQVFYSSNIQGSEELAKAIREGFIEVIGEHCTREIKPVKNEIYLLKKTEKPSVIVECGFLSNAEEEKLLSDSNYQDKVAESICKGVSKYSGKN